MTSPFVRFSAEIVMMITMARLSDFHFLKWVLLIFYDEHYSWICWYLAFRWIRWLLLEDCYQYWWLMVCSNTIQYLLPLHKMMKLSFVRFSAECKVMINLAWLCLIHYRNKHPIGFVCDVFRDLSIPVLASRLHVISTAPMEGTVYRVLRHREMLWYVIMVCFACDFGRDWCDDSIRPIWEEPSDSGN